MDLRYLEDWSGLAGIDTATSGDVFDPIKYIPLSDDGAVWLSLGGEARYRLESWDNWRLRPVNDDVFSHFRLRLHADLHIGDNVRFFVEGKSAHATERDLPTGQRTVDVDVMDLQQAFGEVIFQLSSDATFTFRAGRQEYLFGRQRLVSPHDLTNTKRSWDGFTGILDIRGWRVTGFWSQFVPVAKYQFNESSSATEFYGIYAAGSAPLIDADLDLYWLVLDTAGAAFNGTAGKHDRHTVGGRLSMLLTGTPLDIEVEGAYQFGEVGAGDIDAFFVTGDIGYTIDELLGGSRVFIGAGYASGDDNPGGDVQTFHPLFTPGYAFLGFAAEFGRLNNIDIHTGITTHPIEKMTFDAHLHFFWLADEDDAFYHAGNGPAVAAPTARYIGAEIDLLLQYQFNSHLTGFLGYTHIFAGDVIDESGPSDDADFVYMWLSFAF